MENEIVGGGIVDLMPCSLGASVDADKGDTGAELHVEASTNFFDVGTWFGAEDKALVLGLLFGYECVLELDRICAWAFDAHSMCCLRCVCGEG